MTRPEELARAEMILSVLERFSGYTYSSLMDESVEFLQLLTIERLASNG